MRLAGLPLLDALVGTTHFIMNGEQRVENAKTDDGWSPQTDENGDQLAVCSRSENEHVDREQNRQCCADKIIRRLHNSRVE